MVQEAQSYVGSIPRIPKVPRRAIVIIFTFRGPDYIPISISGFGKTLSHEPEKIFELFAEPFRRNFFDF